MNPSKSQSSFLIQDRHRFFLPRRAVYHAGIGTLWEAAATTAGLASAQAAPAYVCMHVCVLCIAYVCIYLCVCVCIYVYISMCTYVCMYVCMCVCVCVTGIGWIENVRHWEWLRACMDESIDESVDK